MTASVSPLTRACSSLGCPDESLEGFLRLAQRHGLDAVEVRALAGRIDLPAYFAQTYGTPETLARHLAAQPLVRIAAIDTSFRLVGHQAADRQELLDVIPWAVATQARWIRVFDGGQTCDAAFLTEATATLQWWRDLKRRERWPVELMVETHDTLLTGEIINQMIAAAPGTRILWDAHHTWKRGGEDPVQTYRQIRPHVVHIHVKDSVATPSDQHPYAYVLPGHGEFPIAPLLATLRQARFDGCVSLEWERLWHPQLVSLDAALEAAVRAWW